MYQKDYILRMIEMLGDFIARLMSCMKKGDFDKASQSLENAYYDFLKTDAALLRNIPKEELTPTLLEKHNYSNGHLEILAELFYAEAELAYRQDKKARSLEYYEKSLLLFEFVVKETQTFSFDKQSKISRLKKRIEIVTNSIK